MAGKRAASASRRAKPARARKTVRLNFAPATRAAPAPAVSPLAPKTFAALPPLAGVRLASGSAGIRYRERPDTVLAVFAAGTQVAGLFTTSKTASAPVENPVHPRDLLATIYHSVGIDPGTMVLNHLNQPRELVQGEVVTGIL